MFDQLTLSELEALKNIILSGFLAINPDTARTTPGAGPMFDELHDLQSEVSHEHFTRYIKQ